MCGIVGVIGKNNSVPFLLDGLETLEYRGYDSAGIAVLQKGKNIESLRVVGRVDQLRKEESENPLDGLLGIGHTRWATHGKPLERNAHPHHDNKKEFFVVHNGIIENYQEIKQFLVKNGVVFYSDTDTEVVPNLVAYYYEKLGDVKTAFTQALQTLTGAYALALISTHDPEHIYAAKLSSPLAIGVGSGEHFLASDAIPISSRTKKIVYLEDGEMAIISKNSYKIQNIKTEKSIERLAEIIEIEDASSSLGNFPDYMSKEIHEAPQTVRSAMLGRLMSEQKFVKLGGLLAVKNQLQFIDRIIIIACGTSYYAGMVGEYLLEEIANIPVEVQQASEFRYRKEPLSRSTAVLVISQSGETADTISALQKLKGTGILTLGIVNAPGSTLARMTDAGVYCHAGPEKAVASTKAFIAQVTVLTLLSLYLSKNYEHYEKLLTELDGLPKKLETLFEQEASIKKIAEKYSKARDFLYIGRRYGYPVALEGALKLKEISYIHAEGFAGGEMKHGPLALIDENFPTFAIALSGELHEKTISNLQEIRARGGPIIAVVDNQKSLSSQLADDIIVIPKVVEQLQVIPASIATYLFSYYVAKKLNRDIDKPRNLAKSVTVE